MSGVQSIERAFAIMRVLALGRAGVTEIADRTDLPKSTVSRLLAALEGEGAVEQVEWGGEYVLGSALSTLAGSTGSQASFGSVIRPFIEELSASSGGSAGFTLRQDRAMYWVDNVDDDAMVQVADQTGQSFPMHSVPTGLAVLAMLDADELDAYLAVPLEPAESNAPTDGAQLRRLLDGVDDDGLVVSFEELDEGVNAYASPFRGPSGSWDGAVYLQGPSFRFPGRLDDAAVRNLVVGVAAQITERLRLH